MFILASYFGFIIVGIFTTSRDILQTQIHIKKLLQVSDYITLFGGIEMFIFNIGKYLEPYGVETRFHGLKLPLQRLKRMKVFFLPFTGFNIISAIQIIAYSLSFKPDTIWFHGISRYHGRLPVFCSGFFPSQKLMMYHDLGYFHPFPSTITDESQVLPWSYKNRMIMTKQKQNLRFSLFDSFWKFTSISVLRRTLLRTIDKHLVPSEFMVQYLIDWGVNKSSIVVLPHFIAKAKS